MVRAVYTGGGFSGYSNTDLAATVAFSDDPLGAVLSTIEAEDLTQLRTAVSAVRGGRAAGGVGDGELTPSGASD